MGARCGYCKKAEALLKPQIQNGDIVKKSASEAGGMFTGFPAFTSTKTQKTSMGCPKSYEDLAQKLGHTEGYSSGMRRGHHNPYHYNAMPTIAQSSACPTDSAGNLILPSNCDVKDPKQCVSCCQKYHKDNCPKIDQGENQCSYLCSSPSPGPPGKDYDGTSCKGVKVNDPHNSGEHPLDKCCSRHDVCDCKLGLDETCSTNKCYQECIQKSTGGGGGGQPPGDNTKTCSSFPGCGEYGGSSSITLAGGECECGTVGQSFSNLASCCKVATPGKSDLCDQFNCPVGGGGGGNGGGGGGGNGGGGGGNGGGGPCTLGNDDCSDSQYCSIAAGKKCSDPPSTWKSDFYNSALQEMTSGPHPVSPDVAKCLVNGIASSSGCNVTNPSQINTPATKSCVTETVMPQCSKNSNTYPTSPVKSSGGGNGGGKKKSMSHLEIALIVIAVLGLLGLVGFLAYRARFEAKK